MLSTNSISSNPEAAQLTPKTSLWNKLVSPASYFIKQNKSWSAQVFGLTAAAVGVFSYTLVERLAMNEEPALAVSHGMGATIKYVIFPNLIVPFVMRLTTSILQDSYVGSSIGLDRRVDTHKFMASLFVSSSVIHTIGQIYHNPHISYTQEGLTGFALLTTSALPLVSTYFLAKSDCIRKKKPSYEFLFLKPHQIGAVTLISIYAFHTTDMRLLPYACAVIGVFSLDRLVEFIFYHFATVTAQTKIYGRIAEICIAKPPAFNKHTPGQYAYISFVQKEKIFNTSHPFTFANSHYENCLRFYIARNGKWTKNLVDQISNNQFPITVQARIRGPFGSPLQCQNNKTDLILVSTGSGFTPFMALLSDHAHTQAPVKITIIHSSPHVDEFIPYIKVIHYAVFNQVKVNEIHFYLTENNLDTKQQSFIKLKNYIENIGMKFIDVDQIIQLDPVNESNISVEYYLTSESKIDLTYLNDNLISIAKNKSDKKNKRVSLMKPIIHPSLNEKEICLAKDEKNETMIVLSKNKPTIDKDDSMVEIPEYNNQTKDAISISLPEQEKTVLDNQEKNETPTIRDSVFYCHGRRFNPRGNDIFYPANPVTLEPSVSTQQALSKMVGSFFYCGNEKVGNMLLKSCRNNNQTLKKEAFTF